MSVRAHVGGKVERANMIGQDFLSGAVEPECVSQQ